MTRLTKCGQSSVKLSDHNITRLLVILLIVTIAAVSLYFVAPVSAQEASVKITEGQSNSVEPGNQFGISVQVTNIGSSAGTATGLRFTDLPDNIDTIKSGGTSYEEGSGPISITGLAPGGSESFEATVTVENGSESGDYSFNVEGTTTPSGFQGNSEVEYTVTNQSDQGVPSSLTVVDESKSVSKGDDFKLTVEVTNDGDIDGGSPGIQLNKIPNNVDIESQGSSYSEGNGPVSLNSLAPGESESFSLTVDLQDDVSTGEKSIKVSGAVTPVFTSETIYNFTVEEDVTNIVGGGDGVGQTDTLKAISAYNNKKGLEKFNTELSQGDILKIIAEYNSQSR